MTVNVSSMAPGKNYVYLDGAVADKIWVPDVVIDKVRPRDFKSIIISSTTMQTIAIRSPSMVKSGASSIRLYADSTIVYSSRKNYDLACGMVSVLCIISGLFTKSLFVQDFRKFPFDNQTCNLIIHSFGSSTKDYTLKWGLVSLHRLALSSSLLLLVFSKMDAVDRIVNPDIKKALPQFEMSVQFIDDWSSTY